MGYIHRVLQDTSAYMHIVARQRLQSCQVIVDVGCGKGRYSPLFPKAKLIGVDVRSEASVCLQRGYADFYLLDVEREALPRLGADGMVCSHILEHFWRPEQALAHALIALQPGALLYAACPTLHNAHYGDDYTHVRPFTENSLQGLLEDVGLVEVEFLYQLQASFRGAGRVLDILTGGDELRAAKLAKRFPRLRAQANVQALAIYPDRGANRS